MNLSLLSARSFPRKASQTSIFLQEWDIPFEQLEVGELIGKGRFGQVYHGRWHGEVAIRLIDVERDNEDQLKAFKREVMAYRQTRHENVVLFMGACMSPPHLAIITRSVSPGHLGWLRHALCLAQSEKFALAKLSLCLTECLSVYGEEFTYTLLNSSLVWQEH
jgi:serine/threonine protein kinase